MRAVNENDAQEQEMRLSFLLWNIGDNDPMQVRTCMNGISSVDSAALAVVCH